MTALEKPEMRSAARALTFAAEPVAQPPLWAIAAHADTCTVGVRADFVERVRARVGDSAALLVTCHRAEVYGVGDWASVRSIATSLETDELEGRLRVLTGGRVVRHVLRLAAGLESAVVGEDQVLHQVRELRESVRDHTLDPHLSRLFEMAIWVGRKARASRSAGSAPTLATRAIDWLCLEAGIRQGDRLLVAGAGTMGRLLAREARRRRLAVTVASRSFEHASSIARPLDLPAVDLSEAARLVRDRQVAGLAVALAGPWRELDGFALPASVDLSSPASLPESDGATTRRLDIDGLYRWNGVENVADRDEYSAAASVIVDAAVESYRRWAAGRASVDALQALRGRADRERREQLERLKRRLPALGPREQALLEAYSEQLVAAVLHAPTVRLREDVDGSAAEAARRLFDL